MDKFKFTMDERYKIFIFCVILILGRYDIASAMVQLRGTGASFPAQVYQNWMPLYKAYRQQHKNINLTYSAVGSGAGKRNIQTNVDIEYAGSDSTLTTTEKADYPDLILIPSMAGAIVMAYNIPSLNTKLRLTREQVVGIYNGTYRYWNDSTFAESNPNATFPNAEITIIARADKSGTTFAFTTALSFFSDDWRNKYGIFSKGYDYHTNTPYHWEKGVVTYFGEQNRGCSGLILSFKYSIGYLSVADALKARMVFSSIRNKAGYYVEASTTAIQSAMDYHKSMQTGLVFDLADASTPESYAMSSFTYFVVYKSTMKNVESAKELVRYIDWVINSEGPRNLCQQLGFVPLSRQMISLVRTEALFEITVNGENVWNMILSDTSLENTVPKPWLIPIAVTIPIVALILLFMFSYIVFQQIKVQRTINRNEWNIKIEDILFFFDEKANRTTNCTNSTADSVGEMDPNEALNKVLQWPGKWKGHNVGLRLLEVRHFNVINHDMKRVMHWMKEHIIHTNILRFYGLTELEDSRYIIGDYCSKGPLTTVLQDWKYNLSNDMQTSLSMDIANGMAFLHSQGIVHGDLRTSCCLVDFRYTVKISDWEFCKLLTSQDPLCRPLQKLRADGHDDDIQISAYRNFWTAPEVIKSGFMISQSQSSDVYSYAIIMQEIFSRQEPYSEHADIMMPSDVLDAILINDLRPEHAEDTPVAIRQIMEIAWSEDTTSRPTFEQVCKMIRVAHSSRKSMLDSMIDVMEEYMAQLEQKVSDKSFELDSCKKRIDGILRGSLPASIASRLANGETSIVDTYSNIGVIMLQITGIESLINSWSKEEVYRLLQQICTEIDIVCSRYEAYMEEFSISKFSFTLVLGTDANEQTLPVKIGHMSLDLLAIAQKIDIPSSSSTGSNFEFKMAASIGNGIAGIVGTKIPVFAVLGKAKHMAKGLIKISLPSHILITQTLANTLGQRNGFLFKASTHMLNGRYETSWLTGRTENTSKTSIEVQDTENKTSERKSSKRDLTSNMRNKAQYKSRLKSLIKKAVLQKKMKGSFTTGENSTDNLGFKIVEKNTSKLSMCTQGTGSSISFRSRKISPV